MWIQFGDAPTLTLTITVWPNESIEFGYSDADEERRLRPLFERCAKALDAEVVTI